MLNMRIFIGFDSREPDAYAVAERSIAENMSKLDDWTIHPLELPKLRDLFLYQRPHDMRQPMAFADPVLWDEISDAPMSTEFALSRFLVPILAREGWAMFCDCDMLARAPLHELFDHANDDYAVMCVKHEQSSKATRKMDGQVQTSYSRKNWSSVMLFNCDHPSNQKLTLGLVNSAKGLDLHNFCWLEDHEIGEIPAEWNHLVGIDEPNPDAKMAHFTLGIPRMKGYQDCEFAAEWWDALRRSAEIELNYPG